MLLLATASYIMLRFALPMILKNEHIDAYKIGRIKKHAKEQNVELSMEQLTKSIFNSEKEEEEITKEPKGYMETVEEEMTEELEGTDKAYPIKTKKKKWKTMCIPYRTKEINTNGYEVRKWLREAFSLGMQYMGHAEDEQKREQFEKMVEDITGLKVKEVA